MGTGAVYLEPSRRILFDEIATIASGATISATINMRSFALRGFVMPAAFSGTSISFLAAEKGSGTMQVVTDNAGSPVSVTVSAGKYIVFDATIAEKLNSLVHFQLVSNVAEGAARVIILIGVATTK